MSEVDEKRPDGDFLCACGIVNCELVPSLHRASACRSITLSDKAKVALEQSKDLDDELRYLRWFYLNADFGPSDEEVRIILREEYWQKTGSKVPKGYDD